MIHRWQDHVLNWSNVITKVIDSRLSPCPFCGAPGMLGTRPSFREFFAMCSEPGCGAYLAKHDNDGFATADAAIAAWNQRNSR
jgi:hypothetical protein